MVEVRPVNDWRVDEPVTNRFERVERLPVAVKYEPTEKAPVDVPLVVVEFPPIVKLPTKVDEAFWKMFVPDQRLFVVVPKAREINGEAPPVDCTG